MVLSFNVAAYQFVVMNKLIKTQILSQQSGPQDQKSVIFSKNTANIFLTFRNRIKMFLSQNIMHNF